MTSPTNTVMVPCPKCGVVVPIYSKSGLCNGTTYSFADAPDDVMNGVNYGAPFICNNCSTNFYVKTFSKGVHRSVEWTPECELERERWP